MDRLKLYNEINKLNTITVSAAPAEKINKVIKKKIQ